MKNLIFASSLALFSLFGCKQETQNKTIANATPKKTEAELIANAHGFEQWDSVNKIEFAFNVSRGDYNSKRLWQWEPKTGKVTLMTATDTITYNHKQVDSVNIKTDAAFINDKYWLLTPFNLMWDTPDFATLSTHEKTTDPISGDSINKLTITYKNEGGYTPGDAYDLFYNDDYTLSSWIYRKANADTPSMTTSWEDYTKVGPLTLAKSHKDSLKSLNIYFTDLKIK